MTSIRNLACGLSLGLFLIVGVLGCTNHQPSRHVVIVVMDGLRPDAITAENMPTLFAMRQTGTDFSAHHPSYPSTTEVNGASLATGMVPSHSLIIANREYRPEINAESPIDTQSLMAIWTNDHLVRRDWTPPTLVEIARGKGMRTAVAGTKGVTYLWDRSLKNRSVDSPILSDGMTLPGAFMDKVLWDMGTNPAKADGNAGPNTKQDQWTQRIMTEKMWENGVPALSVLWFSEPDYVQHGSGPGTPNAIKGYAGLDNLLKELFWALERKGVKDQTDVLVVSDHGFNTASNGVSLSRSLTNRNLKIRTSYREPTQPDEILMINLGGSASFYVPNHNAELTDKLVEALVGWVEWTGVVFTRDGNKGTFKLSDVDIDSPFCPDVVVSLRWAPGTMKDHLPGVIFSDGTVSGDGTHGSLSPFEMHNTLIAIGPDFKKGYVSKLPSSSPDVTATVAHLLGLKADMDGRVLTEGLCAYPEPADADSAITQTLKATRVFDDGFTWKQYMKVTTFRNRRYFDEGNWGEPGEIKPEEPKQESATPPAESAKQEDAGDLSE